MKFTDEIRIDAPSLRVWEFLTSRECLMPLLSQYGNVEQISEDGGVIGSVYEVSFRPRSNDDNIRVEIVSLEPGNFIALKWIAGESDSYLSGRYGMIAYRIEAEGTRTTVTELIEIKNFKFFLFNWAIKILGLIAHGFKKSTGDTFLRKFKCVVEESILK